MELSHVKELKNNSKRADYAIKVFYALMIMNLVVIVASLYEIDLLFTIRDGGYVSDEALDTNDSIQGILGLIQFSLTIASMITFLNWFRRAFGNVIRIGTSNLDYSESMAVWSFFIPLINLFRPYAIAQDIAEGTRAYPGSGKKIAKNNPVVLGWWISYLIMSFVGNFVFRSTLSADTIEKLISTSQSYLVSAVIDIVAALIVIYMIRLISKDEKDLYHQWKNSTSDQNLMDTFVGDFK